MRFTIGYQVGFSSFLSRYSWLGFPKAIGVSFSLLLPLKVLATEVTQVTNKNTRRASRFNELLFQPQSSADSL